jgi:hypothetical protein
LHLFVVPATPEVAEFVRARQFAVNRL